MFVTPGLSGEGPERSDRDRRRQDEQHDRAPVGLREHHRDQHEVRGPERRHEGNPCCHRHLAQVERALGDRDRPGHEQDARERGGGRREDDRQPARLAERVSEPGDLAEDDHRAGGGQPELREVEDELLDALSARHDQRHCGTGE